MRAAPETIGGMKVIAYTPIDGRHRFTGNTRQVVRGQVAGAMAGLAICRHPGATECYLFGCDGDWQSVTDTWHQSVVEAKEQGEYEYEGVSKTWIDVPPTNLSRSSS